MAAPAPDPVERITCSACGASMLAGEPICWKCGAAAAPHPRAEQSNLIDFAEASQSPSVIRTTPEKATPRPARTLTGEELADADFSAPLHGQAEASFAPIPNAEDDIPMPTRLATSLTGEVVEIPDFSARSARPSAESAPEPARQTEPQKPDEPAKPVMRITFCKTCGIQNEESATECRKCRQPLEVIAEPLPDITPLRRSWGFDVLGIAWIALGLAAAYCGQFIIKSDPEHPGITWGDYIWTGVVVCAPGVLIFMRHWFCRLMFWVMTFASAMIWAVIGFIWLYIGLPVTDNGRVGLMWFAALSGLSLISFLTVRFNDEFDAGA